MKQVIINLEDEDYNYLQEMLSNMREQSNRDMDLVIKLFNNINVGDE